MRNLTLLLLLATLGGLLLWWAQSEGALSPPPATPGASSSDGSAASLAGADGRDAPLPDERVAVQGPESSEDLLTGRLLQGGAPLAGATVLVCKGPSSRAEVLQQAATDPQGRFTLRRDRGHSWLTAVGHTVPRHWKAGWRIEGDTILDLDVPSAGVLEGVVRTTEGAGIAGAEVRLLTDSYVGIKLPDAPDVVTRTDQHGRFRFDRVAEQEDRLTCRAEGYAYKARHTVSVAPGQTAVAEIVLTKGVTLQGSVMDHRGQPLAGATVERSYGDPVQADAAGRFIFSHFLARESLTIRAPGHLDQKLKDIDVTAVVRVQLERSVTLRGTVVGSRGRPGTVNVEPAELRPDASRTRSYDLTFATHDVVRDGKFELPGFPMSDFEVTVRVPGVGEVGPVRVEMRDDVDVTFELVPYREVVLSVRNDLGQLVPNAQLQRDRGIVTYPTLYKSSDPGLLKRIRGSYKRDKPQPMPEGVLSIFVSPGDALAFLVDADDHISEARAVAADALADRMLVTMTRAATLRGFVDGFEQTKRDCAHSVTVFAPNSDKALMTARVEEGGVFVIGKLAPGNYRAAVGRRNTASIGERSFGLPLIDAGAEAEAAVPFVATAGEETVLRLALPQIGRLVGRVMLAGKPVVNAAIVAVRPSRLDERRRKRRARSMGRSASWDDEYQLEWACGQRTRGDGSFTFLYRDAGPVHVYLRHAEAQLSSQSIEVDLPPPGEDVVRDFEMPGGEIRGRYPVEVLTKRERRFFEVTMFPLEQSTVDPFYAPHHGASLSMFCPKIEKSQDGRFAFSYLRSGSWLVRAHAYRNHVETVLWQRVVSVHNGLVDLGELPATPTPTVSIAWRWQGAFAGTVRGVWLRQAAADGSASAWVATLSASKEDRKGGQAMGPVIPGDYEVVPFGRRASGDDGYMHRSIGVSGEPLAEPQRVRVRADGAVEPEELGFVLSPPKESR